MDKILSTCDGCSVRHLMYVSGNTVTCPKCGTTSSLKSEMRARKEKRKLRRREIDYDYVQWVHSWPCVIPSCTSPTPVHAHHAIPRSRLGADKSCLPLCPAHHIGPNGVHNLGVVTFQATHRIDFMELVERYNSLYATGKTGPYLDWAVAEKRSVS